jgi:tripartite motif-containing protein 71
MRGDGLRRTIRGGLLWIFLGLAGVGAAGAEVSLAEARHLFDLASGGGTALSLPSDVAIGSGGRVYVVDGGNHRVAVFSPAGQYLFTIGRKGEGSGEFRDPVGIGADARGRVYVADSGNHRIQIFDANGRFSGSFRTGNGRPIDVAPDAEGKTLYVTGGHRLTAYSPTGQVLRQWGSEGQSQGEFRYPASVLVAPEGHVYVVDALNSRVQIFDPQGKFVFQVGAWGVLPGQLFRPKGVALDSKNRIYVTDSYMDLVEVFGSDYQFQHVLGAKGKIRRVTAPGGMAIDASDRLFVAEMLANKVSVFSLR